MDADKGKLTNPDLIDMSAPAHAFAIKNDMTTHENIHNQFEKRAANVVSQYRTYRGKRNPEKLDQLQIKREMKGQRSKEDSPNDFLGSYHN